MSYLGQIPQSNFVTKQSQTFTPDGSTTSFSLNFSVNSGVDIILVINNVIQESGGGKAFTATGTTLTMSVAPASVDSMYCIFLGLALQTINPGANSVGVSQISDDAVTTGKIIDGAVTGAKLSSGAVQKGFRNIIINGDMSIAQRGTSVTGIGNGDSGYHTVDRFKFVESGDPSTVFTQSQSTDVPSGQGFAKSLKMDVTTADASLGADDAIYVNTSVEGQNLQYIKKGTSSAESLTLSFWVKSNKTGTYIFEIIDRDNDRAISKSYTISSANTWEKKTITYPGDTTGALDNDNARSFELIYWLGAGANFSSGTLQTSWGSRTTANDAVGQVNLGDNTANEWFVTGVQLEAGTTASDFEFLPFDVNMDRCQRYYQKSYAYEEAPGTSTGNGLATSAGNTGSGSSTGQCINTTALIKEMRSAPTIVNYDVAGTSGKVYGIKYGVNEYNGEAGTSFRVGTKYFAVERASGTSIITFGFHYTASAEL